VIAVGGISNAEDAIDFFVAGADAVQVGTATFVDPAASLAVLDGLREFAGSGELYRLSDIRWCPLP
jgi:dihydroorotate dehydrogenase (NAD+) catalytic subunit